MQVPKPTGGIRAYWTIGVPTQGPRAPIWWVVASAEVRPTCFYEVVRESQVSLEKVEVMPMHKHHGSLPGFEELADPKQDKTHRKNFIISGAAGSSEASNGAYYCHEHYWTISEPPVAPHNRLETNWASLQIGRCRVTM